MYKIIGGDGREYGPVTEAELLKWIAEGRLGAQSLAKAESDAEFRALGTFPEFADALGLTAAATSAEPAIDWNKHDYELDIGGCLSRGWTLFMDNFGILLGCTALYLLIFMGAPGVLNAILGGVFSQIIPDTVQYSASYMILQGIVLQSLAALVAGPMTGGYCYVLIQALRGQTVSVGDLFAGFQKAFSRLYLGSLIINLLMIVCFIPFNIVFAARAGPVLVHLKHAQQNPGDMRGLFTDLMSSIASTGPIILLCLIPALYLVTSLWFTLPLIIDQGMDVWTAIRTSFKMVHKHWFTVFGLVFLTSIIYLAGFFLCCVGAFFTVGIATAAAMYAYETIFCERSRN
jgi:hypothetical protein